MPVRVECEIFDTWTKKTETFSLQPLQEKPVGCLSPAQVTVYFGQTGEAVFINVANGLKFTQVFKSAGPGQPFKPVDEIEPAIITNKEILIVESELHNEKLTVRLVNENGNPNPAESSGQSRPTI